MRLSGPAVLLTTLALLAGCGGGDDDPAPATSAGASPAAGSPADDETAATGPTAATGASAASGATESAPVAPLPTDTGGATVVQGRYTMRVSQSDFVRLTPGDEVTWGAVTRCEPDCVVELRRENENGGFKTVELEADGSSRYAVESAGETDRCGGPMTPTTDRTSLSVLKQRTEGAVPLATEIVGFVRVTYKCRGVAQKQVLRLRGRLDG